MQIAFTLNFVAKLKDLEKLAKTNKKVADNTFQSPLRPVGNWVTKLPAKQHR